VLFINYTLFFITQNVYIYKSFCFFKLKLKTILSAEIKHSAYINQNGSEMFWKCFRLISIFIRIAVCTLHTKIHFVLLKPTKFSFSSFQFYFSSADSFSDRCTQIDIE